MSKEERLSWNAEMSQFFKNIGLIETAECLESELMVLSHNQLENLPVALESLVEKLLESLERHVDAKEHTLGNKDKTHKDLLIQKRKRLNNEDEQNEEDERERVKRLNGEQIQIRATTKEVDQRVDTFIQAKRNELDESNRTEFLNRHETSADDVTCARTDAREINRNIQMKFDIVNNEDGPLARSLIHNTATAQPVNSSSNSADLSERLNNIQEHLNVRFDDDAKPSFSVMERVKILENTLMDLERQYPTWSAVHLNQPNRNFPPPPPVSYITRPENAPSIPKENDTTYISTQITTTAPQQRVLKTTGRANSSLTRAVIDQLNRTTQVSVTRQTIESSNP